MNWVEEFEQGNLRALGRLISLAENGDDSVQGILESLYPRTGRSRVVGVTGPPGAGKSTLAGEFVRLARAAQKTVAVVAVDPVSPLTGGSLLGDRIRLVDHFNDPGVFIRSLSTRGKLGGLSRATREAVHLVDAFGFDWVVVETVGVGQSEVDVRHIADASVVTLVPESGDDVQTLKAGLLEIGDIFLVNKSDREGADRLANELGIMLELSHRKGAPVLLTSSKEPETYQAWFVAIEGFFQENAAKIAERRTARVRATASALLESAVVSAASRWLDSRIGAVTNPYAFVRAFLADHSPEEFFK